MQLLFVLGCLTTAVYLMTQQQWAMGIMMVVLAVWSMTDEAIND